MHKSVLEIPVEAQENSWKSELSNFLLDFLFFVIILFVGFDYIEYSVHGLRCISGSNVCRAVFGGHSEPCWRGCDVQQYNSQLLRGHLDLALWYCSNAFLFHFLGLAVMGPNAIFFWALFFLGVVMRVSLDGIWDQNKVAAEEFRHKNWYCILLIKLYEVKQALYFQISMSTTANAARIFLVVCSWLQLFLAYCSYNNLIL